MSYKLSKYAVLSEPFYGVDDISDKKILLSGLTGKTLIISSFLADLLQEQHFNDIPQETLDRLLDIKALLVHDVDETKVILTENRSASQNEAVLYQVIQPSAWCQLGCGYCGQKHEKVTTEENNLEDKIVSRVREKLQQNEKFKHLHIGWFGAEPLTGLVSLRKMSRRLQAIATEFGVGYTAKMVTNGVGLTKKVFLELSEELNVTHFEITLDGPAHVHNVTRPMKSKTNKGSYDRILDNLKMIARQDTKAKVTLRMNVGQANHETVPELIEALIEAGLKKIISPYFAPIHDWGNDASEQSLTIESFSQLELKWYAQLIEAGFQVGLIPTRKPVVCMSLSDTAEVFDSYGDIFNCSEVSQVPAYGKPNTYRLGNLGIDEAQSPARSFQDFNDRIENHETMCSKCYCLPVCGGACPKSWMDGNVPCPSFKFNLKQRLLLQYAQNKMPLEKGVSTDKTHTLESAQA